VENGGKTMTTFQFQTHVSDSGVIMLPMSAQTLYGKDVVLNIGVDGGQSATKFEELCDVWCADERSTEEIIRDIYESRTLGRERERTIRNILSECNRFD
jgi:hypothetical protein